MKTNTRDINATVGSNQEGKINEQEILLYIHRDIVVFVGIIPYYRNKKTDIEILKTK